MKDDTKKVGLIEFALNRDTLKALVLVTDLC